MASPPLILASASPRRRELLGLFGISFDVVPSTVNEAALLVGQTLTPEQVVRLLSTAKAQEVAARSPKDAVVLGADTIVVLDDLILGKPADPADAVRMLSLLSGRTHKVYTGVALVHEGIVRSDFTVTDVTFFPLSPETITAYVATGEPLDKAGAYGIQEHGRAFIARVDGDYYNVVGLPLTQVRTMLHTRYSDLSVIPSQPTFPSLIPTEA